MDSLESFISKQNDPAVDYVAAIRKNLDSNNTKENIQKLFIIPPFTKTHFSSEQTLNAAYNQCVDAIMATIPMQSKGKITITKTWTKVREKNLHTLLLIGPQECQTHFNHLTLHGIQLLGKTIFPTMHQTRSLNLYPKRYNVKINQLPFVCSEAVLIELLKLPEDVQIIESLHRFTEKSKNGEFFNGSAVLQVAVNNKESEENLRSWSHSSRMDDPIDWNGIFIEFYVPAIHFCNFCEAQGHDEDWCYRKQKEMSKRTADLSTKADAQPNTKDTNQPNTCETVQPNINKTAQPNSKETAKPITEETTHPKTEMSSQPTTKETTKLNTEKNNQISAPEEGNKENVDPTENEASSTEVICSGDADDFVEAKMKLRHNRTDAPAAKQSKPERKLIGSAANPNAKKLCKTINNGSK